MSCKRIAKTKYPTFPNNVRSLLGLNFMNFKTRVTLLFAALLVSGCATLSVSKNKVEEYSLDPEITHELSKIKGLGFGIAVSNFTLAEGADIDLYCSNQRPIELPGGQSFAAYVHSAFIAQLTAAGMTSPMEAADVVLSGKLKTFKPLWQQDAWLIAFELGTNRGNDTMRPTDIYSFTNANNVTHSENDCKRAAQAVMPAVQKMIMTIASSWHFKNNLLM